MKNSQFKLLDSYGAKDKDFFFGRESEISSLYNLLQQTQLALIYGASGTGKTSLINAGLPKVYKITDWFKILIRRKDDINISLKQSLEINLNQKLGGDKKDLSDAVRDIFEKKWIPVYLIFDQFEEIFTLGNHEERLAFFQTLKTIIDNNSAVKVIISMREEYIGHLYEYEYILPNLFDKRFRVEPMKDNTITSVIRKTCLYQEIRLEKKNETAQLIKDKLKIGKQPVHLPHLQIYLYHLNEKADKGDKPIIFTHTLINDKKNQLGKVLKQFIHGKLIDAQAIFSAEDNDLPFDFTEKLLDDFSTDVGTKRARTVEELAEKHQQPIPFIQKVLVYFDEKAKLLRADENDVDRYEPVHDLVAQQIHELRTKEDKEYRAFLSNFRSDYKRWKEDEADDRLLKEGDVAKVGIYKNRIHKEADGKQLLLYHQGSQGFINNQKTIALEKLIKEQKLRESAERQSKRAKRFSILALFLAVLSFFFWWHSEETNKELETEKKIAFTAKIEADSARRVADEAREETRLKNETLTQNEIKLKDSNDSIKNTLTALKREQNLSRRRLNIANAAILESEASFIRTEILGLKKELEQAIAKNNISKQEKVQIDIDQKYINAISHCDSALMLVGHSHSVYRTQGELHLDMSKFEKAILSFRKSIQDLRVISKKIEYLKRGIYASNEIDRFKDAIFFYTEIIGLTNAEEKVKYLTERAKTYQTFAKINISEKEKFYQLASKDYDNAIAISPKENRLALFLERGQFNKAIEAYSDALEDYSFAMILADSDSLKAIVLNEQAQLYEFLSDYEKASINYEAAFGFASDKDQRGDIRKKINDIERTSKTDDYLSITYPKELAKADSLFAAGDYGRALDIFNELLKYAKDEKELASRIKRTQERMKSHFKLPTDKLLSHQWQLKNYGSIHDTNWKTKKDADAKVINAWEYMGNLGSPDIIVAIIDNGFDISHPDLKDKIYKPWDLWNKSSKLESGDPRYTHGTAVAGLALASANNQGMVGVAPNARFMPVNGTSFSLRATEEMFEYCTQNGADVIICPWGTTDPAFSLSPLKEQAITKTVNEGRDGKGAIILFAVGNEDKDYINYYADHPNVIAVSASTSKDEYPNYANRGKNISVCAPSNGDWPLISSRASWDEGVNWETGNYKYWRDGKSRGEAGLYKHFGGTTGAVAIVGGICALMLSENPDLTAKQVKEILEKTADKIGDPSEYDENGHSKKFGYGRVNALEAVKEARRLKLEDIDID